MTITEFIEARLAEDEASARRLQGAVEASSGSYVSLGLDHPGLAAGDCPGYLGEYDPARVLAQVAALRAVVALHESWPVLVETPPVLEETDAMTYRMTKQIAWATEKAYREHFGVEPPAAPMLRHVAAIWADHPDYGQEWRP